MVIVPATEAQGTTQSFPAAIGLPSGLVVANRKDIAGVQSDAVIERPSPEEAVVAAAALLLRLPQASLTSEEGAAMKAEFVKELSGLGSATRLAKACAPGSSGGGKP